MMMESSGENRLITAPNLLYLPLDAALETTFIEEEDDEFIELVTKHRMAAYERRKGLEEEFQKRETARDKKKMHSFLSKHKIAAERTGEEGSKSLFSESLAQSAQGALTSAYEASIIKRQAHQAASTQVLLSRLAEKYADLMDPYSELGPPFESGGDANGGYDAYLFEPGTPSLTDGSRKGPRETAPQMSETFTIERETGRISLPSLPSMLAGLSARHLNHSSTGGNNGGGGLNVGGHSDSSLFYHSGGSSSHAHLNLFREQGGSYAQDSPTASSIKFKFMDKIANEKMTAKQQKMAAKAAAKAATKAASKAALKAAAKASLLAAAAATHTSLLIPPGGFVKKKKGRPGMVVEQVVVDFPRPGPGVMNKKKGRKMSAKKREKLEKGIEEDRKKLWTWLVKKQIPKAAKAYSSVGSIQHLNSKRLSHLCAREVRRCYFKNNRVAKEAPFKARRTMREMLGFWKRNEKEEKELRKKAEKLELEKRKAEEEAREARRQARKLNFLINQTELYSHFIAKKGETETETEVEVEVESSIRSGTRLALSKLTPSGPSPPQLSTLELIEDDALDDRILVERAKSQALEALEKQQRQTKEFDVAAKKRREEAAELEASDSEASSEMNMNFLNPSSMPTDPHITQPLMLQCSLKSYQLKGLNWLANLYEQGINGILADEMGLGKTVQSIALMAHLAERQNIWGPFLVIAPASTLHNWQQELCKFTPALKALPYWGSVSDRKVLRKFWTQKKLYSKEAPFHVLVTSYQLVVSDEKYFQRVQWQYMVLDEAQAIKSASSVRWKTLLGFHCRNRLLLTGTPIQNSMQELWALLHFIMPTLFDSHDEFSEWFSKDIESHAEHKSGLNQHQLGRLHMILKPFMLRRIKKDVENELGDKIEIELACELSARQRRFYSAVRRKLNAEDLKERMERLGDADSAFDNLMNLVMQFRKICNHPELLEQTQVQAPYYFGRLHGGNASSGASLSASHPSPEASATATSIISSASISTSSSYDDYWSGASPGLISLAWPCLLLPEPPQHASLVRRFFHLFHVTHLHESLRGASSGFGPLFLLDRSLRELSLLFEPSDALAVGPSLDRVLEETSLARYVYYASQGWTPLRALGRLLALEREGPSGLGLGLGLEKDLSWRNWVALEREQEFLYLRERLPPLYQSRALAGPIELVIRTPPPTYSSRVSLNTARQGWEARLLSVVSSRRLQGGVRQLPLLCPEGGSTCLNGSWMPQPLDLIQDAGKMKMLDRLLVRLKREGHRVLIYFQMTKMIDLMEDYLKYRQYKYLRLDGSSKISDRRDMVTDWQTREEIFIFLLSTRAGGLGINLTAADTVIFYDSDWNPTVDQQAMDRAHRLGQTKQVTVYRLITQGTIEERIQQRAQQKHEIQKVVIAGGEFRQVVELKPKEIVSLLLDEEEAEDEATTLSSSTTARLAVSPNPNPSPATTTSGRKRKSQAGDESKSPGSGASMIKLKRVKDAAI